MYNFILAHIKLICEFHAHSHILMLHPYEIVFHCLGNEIVFLCMVYAFLCTSTIVPMCPCVCVCVCKNDVESRSSYRVLSFVSFYLIFWGRFSHSFWSSLIQLTLLTTELPGPLLLLPKNIIIDKRHLPTKHRNLGLIAYVISTLPSKTPSQFHKNNLKLSK